MSTLAATASRGACDEGSTISLAPGSTCGGPACLTTTAPASAGVGERVSADQIILFAVGLIVIAAVAVTMAYATAFVARGAPRLRSSDPAARIATIP